MAKRQHDRRTASSAASLLARDARDYLDPSVRRTAYRVLIVGIAVSSLRLHYLATVLTILWLSEYPCWQCFLASSC